MTDYFAGDPRSNRERMLAGDLYIADDPESEKEAQRAMALQAKFAAAYPEDPLGSQAILAEFLGSVGEEVHIKAPIYVDYGTYISVGARTFINYNLTALDVAPITIGEDCQIGPNVQLLTLRTPWNRSPAATGWKRPSRSPSGTTSGWAAAPSCWPASRSGRTR